MHEVHQGFPDEAQKHAMIGTISYLRAIARLGTSSAELNRICCASHVGNVAFVRGDDGKVVGYVMWADVCRETCLQSGDQRLLPRYLPEWCEGDIALVLDIVIMPSFRGALIRQLLAARDRRATLATSRPGRAARIYRRGRGNVSTCGSGKMVANDSESLSTPAGSPERMTIKDRFEDWYSLFAAFATRRLRHATPIWIAGLASDVDLSRDPTARDMVARYGYAVPGGTTFTDDLFDHAYSQIMLAEPYGGKGVNGNGGGARVGVAGKMQLKGIGCTPMLGSQVDSHHAYGSLLLDQAATEVIYGYLVEKLLPYGCATIRGIVGTGATTYFDTHGLRAWRESGRTAILLRDDCRRPANVLQAFNFRPLGDAGSVLADIDRVREAHRLANRGDVGEETASRVGYLENVERFLQRSARQFAHARANRLIHGVLSPSNLALDGRWLDLSNVSPLPTGINYKLAHHTPSFLDESMEPIGIAVEMLYTHAKFSARRYRIEPLIEGYARAFEKHYTCALIDVLGGGELCRDEVPAYPGTAALSARIDTAIVANRATVRGYPDGSAEPDALPEIVLDLYLAVTAGSSNDPAVTALSGVLEDRWNDYACRHDSPLGRYEHFVIGQFLQSVRRIVFAKVFYRTRIDDIARQYAEESDGELRRFITDSYRMIDFVWHRATPETHWQCVLVDVPGLDVRYTVRSGVFLVAVFGEITYQGPHAAAAERVINAGLPGGLIWHGFDFVPPILAVLNSAAQLQSTPSSFNGVVSNVE